MSFFFLPLSAAYAANNDLKILATTFPIYQLTKNITSGARNVSVDIIIQPTAGCPHDHYLTPKDIKKIMSTDMLIINGLGLDDYLLDISAQSEKKVVDSAYGIAQLIPYIDKGGAHSDKSGKHIESHEHRLYNPHLFASPKRYALLIENILSALVVADESQAEIYRKNAASYKSKLDGLAAEFSILIKALKFPKIVTQHDVFGYLALDTGFVIIDTIQTHVGEAPSAARIIKLIRSIKKNKVNAIGIEPQFDDKYAKTVATETKVPMIILDPVASGPDDAPLDYYEKVMRANMDNLKKLLGAANQ